MLRQSISKPTTLASGLLAWSAMELRIVGCSGSFPGPDSAASCYLLEADGFRMVIDLGNGAVGSLARYAALEGIDAVCISHLHADHCLDMCSYYVFRTYHPAGELPKIPVYAPAGAVRRLDLANGAESDSLTTRFDFVELSDGTRPIGPFTVTTGHMSHPVETFGFRIAQGGWTLAYSADTGPCDRLVELAADADVLLCEASFPAVDGLPADLHLTARQAGEHAARAGVGQLVLTHLVPWNSQEEALAQAGLAYQGPISLAWPGALVRG
jgi:ribonuclease BN (tRNA processing enzyme)